MSCTGAQPSPPTLPDTEQNKTKQHKNKKPQKQQHKNKKYARSMLYVCGRVGMREA
jgi:hypothetical protein